MHDADLCRARPSHTHTRCESSSLQSIRVNWINFGNTHGSVIDFFFSTIRFLCVSFHTVSFHTVSLVLFHFGAQFTIVPNFLPVPWKMISPVEVYLPFVSPQITFLSRLLSVSIRNVALFMCCGSYATLLWHSNGETDAHLYWAYLIQQQLPNWTKHAFHSRENYLIFWIILILYRDKTKVGTIKTSNSNKQNWKKWLT